MSEGTPSALNREWQKSLHACMQSAPTTPWYQSVCGNRAAVALGAGVLALLLLALLAPPIVQQTSANAFENATLSLPRLLIWSALAGGLVFALPFVLSCVHDGTS